jgi:hypothetical protein
MFNKTVGMFRICSTRWSLCSEYVQQDGWYVQNMFNKMVGMFRITEFLRFVHCSESAFLDLGLFPFPGKVRVDASLLSPLEISNLNHWKVQRSQEHCIQLIATPMILINISVFLLPLGVASCCASIQLVLYDAVNRNKVSIR